MRKLTYLAPSVIALILTGMPYASVHAKDVDQSAPNHPEASSALKAAQTTPDGQRSKKNQESITPTTLQTVIVTAEKRKLDIRNVAASVYVVSQDVLTHATAPTTSSLVQFSPSLTATGGTNNLNQSFNIRGIGTLSFSRASEPSVSTVIDGVVYAASGMAFTSLLNVQRVEILNGPQGTLFGINSSAGAINIVTANPTNEKYGYIEGSVFNDNEYRVRGLFSGPVSKTLDGQLAYSYWNFDGNARNYFNDKTENGNQEGALRGKLLWKPDLNVTGTFIADWSRTNNDCCGQSINIVKDTPFTTLVLEPQLAPLIPGPKNKDINENTVPLTQDTNAGVSAQFDWDLNNGYSVVSISAIRRWTNLEHRDGDFLPGPPGLLKSSVASDYKMEDRGHMSLNQYSQEFRLVSPDSGRFKYVAGVFFFDTVAHDNFQRVDTFCTGSTLPPLANGTVPCTLENSTFTSGSGTEWDKITHANYAVYAQGDYSFTSRLHGIIGARYTYDNVGYELARFTTQGGLPGVGPSFTNADSASNNHASGKIGLRGDLGTSTTAYATYSKGYKGPAFNVFFNMSANNTALIAPETSTDYEAGVKTELLDKRLQLNTSIFYTKFDGFQTNSFILVNGTIITNLINAGTVSTRGAEIDFRALPAPGFTVSGGFAYTDAKVVKFNCPIGAPLTCEFQNGKQFATPKYKLVMNADYELPFRSLPFVLDVNTNYSWQSSQTPISQAPYATQPSYGLWNLGLVASDSSGKYSVSLVVQNVLNKFYAGFLPDCNTAVVGGQVVSCATYVRTLVPRDARRIVGLVGRVTF